MLTNLLKDVMSGFKNLHTLVLMLKIAPEKMTTFEKHKAYNISAGLVLAVLFCISINLYSSASQISFAASGLTSVISIIIIGFIGFFVNLAAPVNNVFVPDVLANNANARTQKWATYFTINLILMVAVFILMNVICLALTDKIMVNYLREIIEYDHAIFLQVLVASIIATGIVFGACFFANKVVSKFASVLFLFIITNIVCMIIFYVVNFKLFA